MALMGLFIAVSAPAYNKKTKNFFKSAEGGVRQNSSVAKNELSCMFSPSRTGSMAVQGNSPMTTIDPAQALRDFEPRKKFFIGIDSDGCVFDTMEIKHKECFAPMFVKHFHLQAASKYARQAWEHVNLYS